MNTTIQYTEKSIDNEMELLPIINVQVIPDLFNTDGTFGWSDYFNHGEFNMGNSYIQDEVGSLFNSSGTFEWSDIPCLTEGGNIKFQPKEQQPPMKSVANLLPVPPSPTTVCATISKEVQFGEEDAVMTTEITRITRPSVRFASSVQVRTHSVMVGDHPCCMDGMAIELGWESNDSTTTLRDHKKSKKEATRLSYAQRVQRLHAVTSLTYSQLWVEEYLLKLSLDNLNFAQTFKEERFIFQSSKMDECKSNDSSPLQYQVTPSRPSRQKLNRPAYAKECHPLVTFQPEEECKNMHQMSKLLMDQLDPRRPSLTFARSQSRTAGTM